MSKVNGRRVVLWSSFLGILLVVTFVLFELVVRVARLAPPVQDQYATFVADSDLSYRHEPNSVVRGVAPYDEFEYEYRHNSVGFRDVEHAESKPKGVFRILGLGDSFTYGAGAKFDETYLTLLERMLNERPGQHPRVEIVKAGISRSFTQHERLVLEKYGKRYQPDLVVVGFTPNDVLDTRLALSSVTVTGEGRLTMGGRDLSTLELFLYKNLATWRMARYFLFQRTQRLYWWKVTDVDFNRPVLGRIDEEFEKIALRSRELNARFGIVYIPHESALKPGREALEKEVASWATKRAGFFVPSLERLRAKASSGTPLYYARDGHCTPAGYRIIAQALFDALTQQKLVP